MPRFFLPVVFIFLAASARAGYSISTAAPASSEDETALSGWDVQGSSLLLHDSSGSVISEIGLGHWEDVSSGRITALDIKAGASPNRRFGWTLESRIVWNLPRTRKIEDRERFRFYGTTGVELWHTARAAMPGECGPVAFSRDGEVLLLAMRDEAKDADKRWFVAVDTYLGNTIFEVGPFPRLLGLDITPNGRYALVRWLDPDKSATHTLLDVKTKARKDIPSEKFLFGAFRYGDDGKVYSGKRLIFDFASP